MYFSVRRLRRPGSTARRAFSRGPRDPEPPVLPHDLQLSFHAKTTLEQLCGFLGLELPEGSVSSAEQSVGSLLASSTSSPDLRIGALLIKAGVDREHVLVSWINEPALA